MNRNPKWKREELILVLDAFFRYYPRLPGKTSPEVNELSRVLNTLNLHDEPSKLSSFRNPAGVYMKMMNFLPFHPEYTGEGLKRSGKLDRQVFEEFYGDRNRLRKLALDLRKQALTSNDLTCPHKKG